MISNLSQRDPAIFTIFFSTRLNIKLILIFCSVSSLRLLLFLIAMKSANLLSYNQQIEKAEIREIAIGITNDIQKRNLESGHIEQVIPMIQSIQKKNENLRFLVLDYKGHIIYRSHNFQLQDNLPQELLQEKLNVTQTSEILCLRSSYCLFHQFHFKMELDM